MPGPRSSSTRISIISSPGCSNLAVHQIEQVTQSNAANAEESASASHQLSVQAQRMTEIVRELTVVVNGSDKTTTSRALPMNDEEETRPRRLRAA